VGFSALSTADDAAYNIAIGNNAMVNVPTGNAQQYNVAVGVNALLVVEGNNNLAVGGFAGDAINTGNNNVLIGHNAGSALTSGSGNLFIGYQAAQTQETTGSNKLYIANSNTAIPLIYGEFDGAGGVGVKIHSPATAAVGLIVKGKASQSANLQEWQDSSANVLCQIDSGGRLIPDLNIDVNSVYIGTGAGNLSQTNAINNTGIGASTLDALTTGDSNVALGTSAGSGLTTGGYNVAIGVSSQDVNSTATHNTSIGYLALWNVGDWTKGSNVAIGAEAGSGSNTSASVMLGYNAGKSYTASDNVLIIENSSDITTPLIFGDFADGNITIKGLKVSAHYDIGLLGDGVLMMTETTTPTADTNYGKVYCKNDNKLYFQDGAGAEHEVAFV
jgi:hypothetical protein